jgi:hypothetical protein
MNAWSVLFATPLFAYSAPSFPHFSFYTPYLLVPFAALLGRRYGVSGVVSIALGGLALVPSISGHWGGFGGSPALYLIALAVAAIAALPRPLAECLRWPEEDRAAWWLGFAAPFLLVLYIGTGRMESAGGGLHLSFGFGFSSLGYFLLFVLGARGARMTALLLGLAAAAALGWTLMAMGLLMRPHGALYLSIRPLQPSAVLGALAMTFAGAATSDFLGGRPLASFWQRPYWVVAALVVLWFGPAPIAALPVDSGFVRTLHILQVAAALPLAAFMAGLLRGARGVIFVTVLVAGLTLVWTVVVLAMEGGARFNLGGVALEAPFVAAAYGVMGAKAAELRSGQVDFRMLRLPAFLSLLFLFVLGATLAILDGGGPVRTTLAALFVLGVIAVFVAAVRLDRAMAAKGLAITSEKWAPFVVILGVVGSVAANLQVVGGQLKQLFVLVLLPLSLFSSWAKAELRSGFGSEIDGETLALLLVAAAVYLIVFVATVRGMWRIGPKIYTDLCRIIAFLRQWRQGRPA